MDRFLTWLAVSPLADAARAGAAAALAWLLNNVGGLGLEPIVAIALGAALPPIIRALNPKDGVFGKGSTEVIEDDAK